MEGALQKVNEFIHEFKSDKTRVKQALGATGAVIVFAGGLFGLQAVLKNKTKPPIKHLSPALSHYLLYNEDWHTQLVALSDYAHFAQASFERLAEAAAYLIYITTDLDSQTPQFSKLYQVAQLIGIVVESIRVLRAHLAMQYSQVPQVMLEFDEIAGNIQQICNDTQYNVDNILAYKSMTK